MFFAMLFLFGIFEACTLFGPASVTSVTVSGAPSVQVSNTITLTAEVEATRGADESVTWTSSSNDIATVDTDGVVTEVAVGNVVITARSVFNTDIDGDHEVRVTAIPMGVNSVTISGSNNVQISNTISLAVRVVAIGGADESVTWTSSDTNRSTVDTNGAVTGVAAGTVTITARSVFDTNRADTHNVTVTPIPPMVNSVMISGSTHVQVSNTITLTATVVADDGADESLTWTSSDTGIATVNTNGVVTGVTVGNVTITARSVFDTNQSDTHNVTVTLVPPQMIYGYRLTVSTANNNDNATHIIFQQAEGGIHDGTSTVDLLAGVAPTTDTTAAFGGQVGKFNDGSDSQTLANTFHSVQNGSNKMVQVLGTNRLIATSGVFRIRVVGRDGFRERGNGVVVTLLNADGNPVGTASSASTGFVRNNNAHDGFVVDFNAIDGTVLTQPTIFDLNGNLPALPDPN